ncbi:MAG: UDPGP type 1 family protein [Gemmataceae bacterium]
MGDVPSDLLERLRRHGQEHVLSFWPKLAPGERAELVAQLRGIDFAELTDLYRRRDETYRLPALERLAPLPRPKVASAARARWQSLASAALAGGKVAYLVVAGGQGSRLGFDKPKGMYPIGPVTQRTLFHIHAERILALSRRHGASLPFLVMTSPATDADTRAFFQEQRFFGLPEEDVWFFEQGTMPALDLATGRVLLEAPSRLFLSPNGHGGTLTGLKESGLLERLRRRGVETIYYFQVDNPLVNLADLDFIGQHLAERAEVSNKVIAKEAPSEKLGNYVLLDGRLGIIEYSDLTDELARLHQADGGLFFWAGNPAIHLFDLAFLEGLVREGDGIPWHVAKKKVPYLDDSGRLVEPDKANALKFERFIFDVLPRAERWTVLPIRRDDEFEPLKNVEGKESPATVRRALTEQAARWLEAAGAKVERDAAGEPRPAIEVSPLFALDADELARKIETGLTVAAPLVLA